MNQPDLLLAATTIHVRDAFIRLPAVWLFAAISQTLRNQEDIGRRKPSPHPGCFIWFHVPWIDKQTHPADSKSLAPAGRTKYSILTSEQRAEEAALQLFCVRLFQAVKIPTETRGPRPRRLDCCRAKRALGRPATAPPLTAKSSGE